MARSHSPKIGSIRVEVFQRAAACDWAFALVGPKGENFGGQGFYDNASQAARVGETERLSLPERGRQAIRRADREPTLSNFKADFEAEAKRQHSDWVKAGRTGRPPTIRSVLRHLSSSCHPGKTQGYKAVESSFTEQELSALGLRSLQPSARTDRTNP